MLRLAIWVLPETFILFVLLIRTYFPHKQNYEKISSAQLLGHAFAESKATCGWQSLFLVLEKEVVGVVPELFQVTGEDDAVTRPNTAAPRTQTPSKGDGRWGATALFPYGGRPLSKEGLEVFSKKYNMSLKREGF